jgi:hypothetical protein
MIANAMNMIAALECFPTINLALSESGLLERAGYRGEGIIRVRADQANSADYQHQNHRQHHRILGDILTIVLEP